MTGMKKLRALTCMMEERTGGKQQFTPDYTGGVYIKQEDDAAVGMQMRRVTDRDNDCCRLEFQAYIRRMGVNMSSADLRKVADEVKQAADLLADLEREPVTATEEEMATWAKEVAAMQVDRAIEQVSSREPQIEPTMGGW